MANIMNSNVMPPLTAQERAQRSVFVGNIPYEATEEQLKEIFIQAGPVVSFRLVYDRETGKPKGYGFCEYQDTETAQSAMRNLNNTEFNGRPLRVGVAAGETSKDELKNMQLALGGAPVESPFGDPVSPDQAPEAISRAVASLPPEQMFELMKQMKLCIQNNPNEARNMLLQNPQLAYALLQAQIVMKIVDPQVAMAMLHRETHQVPPVVPGQPASQAQPAQPVASTAVPLGTQSIAPSQVPGSVPGLLAGGPGGLLNMVTSQGNMAPVASQGLNIPQVSQPGPGRGMHDIPSRGPGPMGVPGPGGMDVGHQRGMRPQGPGGPGPARPEMRDPRSIGGAMDPRSLGGAGDPRDPRDPRSMGGRPGPGGPVRHPSPAVGPGAPGGGAGISAQDQEKAALIMQVLQLSDQQIAMLPPEQRESIMILKQQIARSGTGGGPPM
ncbi:cleavage stimulation factor subunit 2-like [Lingula anatina]|uniref:Cleavage stimulation factor subunit 2 isoform X1 n=1 Tax=Lingula anatina TaxID=7574 RepID=A0A1S3HI59_LINAN|nr:cleavage stimulation factor subunit 2 isoform X1 [Lingula anatina]XP_013385795.1 cleavage stimulation factor subunit 2 isoform X2 [Lingula anatina]XP_013385796.1 cleavage stimulation factor subunit 2 isoform X3 [Lingula anatina]XP_013396466.1 cleavage stimulation factor subunit 2-like [Lingula anatina]|eukprot:XP_013385794.1 cleavage stimulation factor subunit 2 isoform X1 [Lingula anatina]